MPNRPLTKDMIARGTPPDVDVHSAAAPPRPDPTMGVRLPAVPSLATPLPGKPARRAATGPAAAAPAPALNRLVVIGDSLSHGFKSGAIHDTHLSWPAIVAWELGIDRSFRRPTYDGFGGLPLNVEWLLHELESRYGDKVDWWELAPAAFSLRHLMAQVEDWWERGGGSHTPRLDGIVHNLSVYGWDLRDGLAYSAAFAERRIAAKSPKDNLLSQLVECARERAALRVLDSARDGSGVALTPVQAAQTLGRQGGVETLVVMLGANNALATVLELGRPRWSGPGYDDLERKNDFNVWRPDHFAAELKLLLAEVRGVGAAHVILSTVPHVTIAPIARGVGGKYEPGSRFFPYYTRPWIADRDFNPADDPHLTSAEARSIDSAIDQYNSAIADAVTEARRDGLDWYVLDLCGMLDRLATRRYIEDPNARPSWWTPYELPPDLASLRPAISSRFFRSDARGRTEGGIFSLDGVHPTTVGYGLMAQEVINIMQLAGVRFHYGDDQAVERTGRISVDFNRLLRLDTLMRDPPRSLNATLDLIGWLDQHLGFLTRLASEK